MTNDKIIKAAAGQVECAYGLVFDSLRRDFDCNAVLDALARAGLELDRLMEKAKPWTEEQKKVLVGVAEA